MKNYNNKNRSHRVLSDEEKIALSKFGTSNVHGHTPKGDEPLNPSQRKKAGRDWATFEEAVEDLKYEAYRNVKHGNSKAEKNERLIKENVLKNGGKVDHLELIDSKCYDPRRDMRRSLRSGVEVDWRKIVAGKCADLMRNYAGWVRTHTDQTVYDNRVAANLAKEVERIATTIPRNKVMNAAPEYEFSKLRHLFNDFYPDHEVWKLIAIY